HSVAGNYVVPVDLVEEYLSVPAFDAGIEDEVRAGGGHLGAGLDVNLPVAALEKRILLHGGAGGKGVFGVDRVDPLRHVAKFGAGVEAHASDGTEDATVDKDAFAEDAGCQIADMGPRHGALAQPRAWLWHRGRRWLPQRARLWRGRICSAERQVERRCAGAQGQRHGLRRGPEDGPVGRSDLHHQPVTLRQPVSDAVQRNGDAYL